jgi:hypothetical protein
MMIKRAFLALSAKIAIERPHGALSRNLFPARENWSVARRGSLGQGGRGKRIARQAQIVIISLRDILAPGRRSRPLEKPVDAPTGS